MAILGLCSAFIVMFLLVISTGITDKTNSASLQPTSSEGSSITEKEYQFIVYTLNETTRIKRDNGTFFSFSVEALPFEFDTIQFGDFRADSLHCCTYYGGSGILVDASGADAVIMLRESNGKLISTINYHGQNPIVFNGETRFASYPNATSAYCGTDEMIQDWREGAWSPSDGILLEHSGNVSLASSRFFLLVLEPVANMNLPEFDVVPAVVAASFVILITARFRRWPRI